MTNKHIIRILSWVIIFLLMTPLGAMPQDTGESAPSSANFTKEELDQMLAPIALYPDSLLSQILMASTYPIEVVDADRWVKQNPNLTGNQLDEALKDKDWDVSVKSLCHFPSVLSAMSQNLDETTRLGNAFLNQQQDVMDTIQELRDKARAQDNLNTTPQQKVIFQQGATEIVPTDPAVIYVPMYDPAVVYGPWWYPAYPPYAWYPGVTIGLGISFEVGFFVGVAVGSWCGFDWGHHDVNVDIHRTTVFNNVNIYNVHEGWQRWDHNPQHRMGVAYWNKSTSQRFGQPATRPTEFRNQYRGYGENEFKAQSLHQGQLKKGGSTFGSFGGTKRGNYETSYNTRSLHQEQFKRGGSTSGSYSGMHWGGHQTSYDTRSLQQKQFKQGGSVGGSFSSSKGGGHDSAFSGINNWNSEHTASQRGWSSYNQSFGGGGHGGGGSHSGGGQKNQKGH